MHVRQHTSSRPHAILALILEKDVDSTLKLGVEIALSPDPPMLTRRKRGGPGTRAHVRDVSPGTDPWNRLNWTWASRSSAVL